MEHFGHLGKGGKRPIELHQRLTQARLLDRQAIEGKIQCVTGDLPEIDIAALERAEPGVLKLLVAPKCCQGGTAVLRNILAATGSAADIQNRAIAFTAAHEIA